MTFIVTLVALLIERFFDWSHLRNWQWYALYQRQIFARIPGLPPLVKLAAGIIPLLLAVLLLEFLLKDALYGVLSIFLNVFVLLYCLGPKNLWADTFASITALANANEQEEGHQQLLHSIFSEANQRVFSVVFWYAILGPVGALLYRLLAVSAQDENMSELVQPARMAEAALDWVPARVLTFIFALGGHFNQVLTFWTKNIALGLMQNDQLLSGSGLAALGITPSDTLPSNGSAERDAVSLLDRSFIIVLIILLIFAFVV